MKKEMVCIICPSGCRLTVEDDANGALAVTGNKCKRGVAYARGEATDPRRSLTTTVRIQGAGLPVLPVKSKSGIPKAMIFEIMKECAAVKTAAPVKAGDIIIKDVLGTGIDIISTANMEKVE